MMSYWIKVSPKSNVTTDLIREDRKIGAQAEYHETMD
jgi:hypothetical protein